MTRPSISSLTQPSILTLPQLNRLITYRVHAAHGHFKHIPWYPVITHPSHNTSPGTLLLLTHPLVPSYYSHHLVPSYYSPIPQHFPWCPVITHPPHNTSLGTLLLLTHPKVRNRFFYVQWVVFV